MKTYTKLRTMLKGKKRYLMMAVVCAELVSLPAAAQILSKVSFEIGPIVTAVEIPTSEPGLSRFLVASNSAFGVEARDVVGNVTVAVKVSGTMNGVTRFGDAAQLPGFKSSCSQTTGFASSIYIADRQTAAREATLPEQAVVFEFRYAADARPTFDFIAGTEAVSAPSFCSETTT